MGQVAIQLNGRSYSLLCEDGDEQRLLQLSAHVRDKLDGVVKEYGQAGEARLLLMTALLITDELFDVRADRDAACSSAAAAALREVAQKAKAEPKGKASQDADTGKAPAQVKPAV